MSVPPCQVVPLLLLVLPTVAVAQPGGLGVAPAARQLELSQTPRPELWVAPGRTTWVGLDAPLDMSAMRQTGPVQGLRRVEVSERAVGLVPTAHVEEGTRLEFTLWFADGQPAQGVTLVLTVDSAKAEPEVEVYRGEIPSSALKRRVAALTAQVEALSAREASLSSLVAAGLVGPAGVQSLKLPPFVEITGPGLSSGETWLHVAAGRVVLEVSLTLAPGAPPWAPSAVTLTEASHTEPLPVRGVSLLGGAALQPGNTTRLVVEWQVPLETEDLVYTLQVDERSGERRVKATRFRIKPKLTRPSPRKEKKP